jgi:hypothetical protein
MVKSLAFLLVAALPYGCASSPSSKQAPAHQQPVAQAATETIRNNPDVLIHHCGRPDHVSDSQWYQPGATIPSRTLTYSKAHLNVTYVSAGQSDPPKWNFSALVDTETNRALDTTNLNSVLEKRLPCAVLEGKHQGAATTEQTGVRTPKPEGRNHRSDEALNGE